MPGAIRRLLPLLLLPPLLLGAPPAAAGTTPGPDGRLLVVELDLSQPEPTQALEGLDHLASMAAFVDVRIGPYTMADLIEGLKTLLKLEGILLELGPVTSPGFTGKAWRLALAFREGFPARESAAPLLKLAEPAFTIDPRLRWFSPRGTFAVEALGMERRGTFRFDGRGRHLDAVWTMAGASIDLGPIPAGAREELRRRGAGRPFATLLAGPSPALAKRLARPPLPLPAPRWFGASVAFRPDGPLEFLALLPLDGEAGAPGTRAALAALAERRDGLFERSLPEDVCLFAAATLPDFAPFAKLPRGSPLPSFLWLLGLDLEHDVAPLARPRIGLALRRERSAFDFMTGEDPPSAFLLLEGRGAGEATALRELLRTRVEEALNAKGDCATRSVDLGGGRGLDTFALETATKFKLELSLVSAGRLFAAGHGFDCAGEIARLTGEARTLAGSGRARPFLSPDAPFALYADMAALGPLAAARAEEAFGVLDRRTRDIRRLFDKFAAISLAAAFRDGALEARLAILGVAR